MKTHWALLAAIWGLSWAGTSATAQFSAPPEQEALERLVKKTEELLEQKNYEEVVTLLEREVAHYPRSSDLRYYLGMAHFESRRYEKAMRWLLEAAALSPQDEDVVIGLAYCYLSLGEAALGLEKAKQAVSLSPNDSMARLLLGIAYLLKGEGTAAIPILEKLAKRADNQTVFYALAAAYRIVGRESDSWQALWQAWSTEDQLDPLSPQRQRVVRGLQRHESQHLIVLLPSLAAAETERVLNRLERVYERVAEMLQGQPASKIEVAVYPDETTFRRLYPNSAISVEEDSRRLIVPSPSSVIDDTYTEILTAGMLQQFVISLSDSHAPFWLSKGLRLSTVPYEGKTDFAYTLARKLKESQSVPLSVLELFPYDKMYAAYTIPYFATRYLIETYGYGKLGKFLQELGKGKAVEAALKETMGIDYAGLTKGWQELAKKELQKHEGAAQ